MRARLAILWRLQFIISDLLVREEQRWRSSEVREIEILIANVAEEAGAGAGAGTDSGGRCILVNSGKIASRAYLNHWYSLRSAAQKLEKTPYPDHIFHMQRAVLLARAILFPYFSHNALLYMGFIPCDIMVMHFNVLSFIAASRQLFTRAFGKYLLGVDLLRIYNAARLFYVRHNNQNTRRCEEEARSGAENRPRNTAGWRGDNEIR